MAGTARGDDYFFVTQEVLDIGHYHQLVTAPAYGAVASFLGTVRSPNLGQNVRYIDYEGYDAMIKTQMAVVAGELREAFELGHLVLAHRLGRLYEAEISIAVVASSKHRAPALNVIQQGINRCKDLLPVWKYEVTEQGSSWVEGSSAATTPLQ